MEQPVFNSGPTEWFSSSSSLLSKKALLLPSHILHIILITR